MESQYNQLHLVKAKENLLKMLIHRGYNSPDNKQVLDEVHSSIYSNTVSFNLELDHPRLNRIAVVIFNTHEKVKKDALQEYLKYCRTIQKEKEGKEIKLILIISKSNLMIFQAKNITNLNLELKPEKIKVEIFELDELQFSVVDSNYVPEHILLTPEEKDQILKEYNITHKNQLPKILHNDVVAKYYGAEIGDVFQITRNSETTGRTFFYRLVI